jgi:hypothetical protein
MVHAPALDVTQEAPVILAPLLDGNVSFLAHAFTSMSLMAGMFDLSYS